MEGRASTRPGRPKGRQFSVTQVDRGFSSIRSCSLKTRHPNAARTFQTKKARCDLRHLASSLPQAHCSVIGPSVGQGNKPWSTATASNYRDYRVRGPICSASAEEAGKIYYFACDLLARTIRPEKPPRLHPRFVLVLGADANQVLRTGSAVEIQLKSWDADKFAEAMVLVAAREVLQVDDLMKIARQSVSSAEATVSADRLRQNQ